MKRSFTHYYVQAQEEGGEPQIVVHSVDEETKEQYHLFLKRKQADDLLKEEKKLAPDVKFRVVKSIESFDAGEWI